ncbi:DgyrCDS6334 [Dimorphilus gyrociliatus]|uniref:DgyrCDS6334 n=1 Tax=Dimorphilus gyrociliatus TaxID=2664684 RepID=A0A7I8VMR3_9ANNE|nr:DgyrCDS6334 [Dimorphilus gyrociliatus]
MSSFKELWNLEELDEKPQVIVFDLDYTLWPFYVDCEVTPPFQVVKDVVLDRNKHEVKHYYEVLPVLEKLGNEGYELAIASRTGEVAGAKSLMNLFGWMPYFKEQNIQIYPGDKKRHFDNIQRATKVPYNRMIFFDDEWRNIRSVSELGVTCVYVKKGISIAELKRGFEEYKLKNSIGS